jgi:hypothetical protein
LFWFIIGLAYSVNKLRTEVDETPA